MTLDFLNMTPSPPPPASRKRKASDWGYFARQDGMSLDDLITEARKRWKSPAFQRAAIEGWQNADRQLWLADLPDCPVCHQPCVPPEDEEGREGLDLDHPWHPDNGRKLPT